MRKGLAISCALLLFCLACFGCSEKSAEALGPEEFYLYSEASAPISPADTGGEFTITKSGVATGSSGIDGGKYEGQTFRSKRGIALGSSLDQLAQAYPDLRFNVIYGQSEAFKVETGIPLKKIAGQAKKGADIVFVLYSERRIEGQPISDRAFDAYCKEHGLDSLTLSSDPGKYGYECWSMIYGISGETVDSLSFTAICPAQPSASPSAPAAEG